MASERVKSLSYSELIQKYKALFQYIRDVEEEIELRDQKSGDNTFPLFKQGIKEKSFKKSSPKKKSPVKKNNDEDIKNKMPVIATINIIKEVLDERDISYKSNLTKEQFIKIVRDHHLTKACNSAYEKSKKAKK